MKKNMKKEIESFDTDLVSERENQFKRCVCPQCGHETSKRNGMSCENLHCPICDTVLVRK